MKRRILILGLFVSLLLTGCSWLDGNYVSVTPHYEQSERPQTAVVSATNYPELVAVLESYITSGLETGVISLSDYEPGPVEDNMAAAIRYILEYHPIGAYAVEEITYEAGTNTGKAAVSVNIQYSRSRLEIHKVRSVYDMEEAAELVGEALKNYDTVLTMEVEKYKETDFAQIVQDYAREYPQSVMEIPQVTSETYGKGYPRMVELTFTYQTSRDALRLMQSQVQPVFDSAVLYVSGEGADSQKFYQLYGFLMERFDYILETSITPAYSLLRHGVGDSRAFAEVYAAMCRASGLECMTVTGTRNGEPWTWNIVKNEEHHFHVDLLRSNSMNNFNMFSDSEMEGYVWDYSAYPACGMQMEQETESAEQP